MSDADETLKSLRYEVDWATDWHTYGFLSHMDIFWQQAIVVIENFIGLGRIPAFKLFMEFDEKKVLGIREVLMSFKGHIDVNRVDVSTFPWQTDVVPALQDFYREHGFSEAEVRMIGFPMSQGDIQTLSLAVSVRLSVREFLLPDIVANLQALSEIVDSGMEHVIFGKVNGAQDVPTTLGKRFSYHLDRLADVALRIFEWTPSGNISGRVGNNAISGVTLPKWNFNMYSQMFVGSLGLQFSKVEDHTNSLDSFLPLYQDIKTLNTLTMNLAAEIQRGLDDGTFVSTVEGTEILRKCLTGVLFGGSRVANSLIDTFSDLALVTRYDEHPAWKMYDGDIHRGILRNTIQSLSLLHIVLSYVKFGEADDPEDDSMVPMKEEMYHTACALLDCKDDGGNFSFLGEVQAHISSLPPHVTVNRYVKAQLEDCLGTAKQSVDFAVQKAKDVCIQIGDPFLYIVIDVNTFFTLDKDADLEWVEKTFEVEGSLRSGLAHVSPDSFLEAIRSMSKLPPDGDGSFDNVLQENSNPLSDMFLTREDTDVFVRWLAINNIYRVVDNARGNVITDILAKGLNITKRFTGVMEKGSASEDKSYLERARAEFGDTLTPGSVLCLTSSMETVVQAERDGVLPIYIGTGVGVKSGIDVYSFWQVIEFMRRRR